MRSFQEGFGLLINEFLSVRTSLADANSEVRNASLHAREAERLLEQGHQRLADAFSVLRQIMELNLDEVLRTALAAVEDSKHLEVLDEEARSRIRLALDGLAKIEWPLAKKGKGD